jgi:hypothetical protein
VQLERVPTVANGERFVSFPILYLCSLQQFQIAFNFSSHESQGRNRLDDDSECVLNRTRKGTYYGVVLSYVVICIRITISYGHVCCKGRSLTVPLFMEANRELLIRSGLLTA